MSSKALPRGLAWKAYYSALYRSRDKSGRARATIDDIAVATRQKNRIEKLLREQKR